MADTGACVVIYQFNDGEEDHITAKFFEPGFERDHDDDLELAVIDIDRIEYGEIIVALMEVISPNHTVEPRLWNALEEIIAQAYKAGCAAR